MNGYEIFLEFPKLDKEKVINNFNKVEKTRERLLKYFGVSKISDLEFVDYISFKHALHEIAHEMDNDLKEDMYVLLTGKRYEQ